MKKTIHSFFALVLVLLLATVFAGAATKAAFVGPEEHNTGTSYTLTSGFGNIDTFYPTVSGTYEIYFYTPYWRYINIDGITIPFNYGFSNTISKEVHFDAMQPVDIEIHGWGRTPYGEDIDNSTNWSSYPYTLDINLVEAD